MPISTFDMPRATKYVVPGLAASISFYIYVIISSEEMTRIYQITKDNAILLIISGSVILGFSIASLEHKYYKILGGFYRVIYKKPHPYQLRPHILEVIKELKSQGMSVQLSEAEITGEKIRSEFWMWLVEQHSYPEIIFRQSLMSMYLFMSWVFLIDILLVANLLPNVSLIMRIFVILVLFVFGLSSYTTSQHYNERFIDYYIYYFKKYILKFCSKGAKP